MKVTMVGTGCTWYARNNTSFVLDDNMLFDISSGNYKFIAKHMDIFDINAIFVSHLHADHVGDLIVITTRFIRESSRRGITRKLRIYGPKGVLDLLLNYAVLFHGASDERDVELLKSKIDFIDVFDGYEFEESNYKIRTYKMLHGSMDCYGYSFEDSQGKVVSFSADTSLCDNLEKMLSISNFALVDMAGVTKNINHLDVETFYNLQKTYSNCSMIPVHTSDQSMELAKKYDIKMYNDGDILYL